MDAGFLKEKHGPLPTWAWMLIGLGVAVTISVIRNNLAAKKKADQDTTADTETGDADAIDLIGGNQRPPIVFQNYVTSLFTPPVGGRNSPPTAPPPVTTPPAAPPPVSTDPVKPPVVRQPPPGKPPATKPPAPKPAGQWVTVSKWTAKNPPWNSTVWGIANHIYHNGSRWTSIWNAPQNSALKTRRKDPQHIQPGDKIWVPA